MNVTPISPPNFPTPPLAPTAPELVRRRSGLPPDEAAAAANDELCAVPVRSEPAAPSWPRIFPGL